MTTRAPLFYIQSAPALWARLPEGIESPGLSRSNSPVSNENNLKDGREVLRFTRAECFVAPSLEKISV
jgi:hypothetical protein